MLQIELEYWGISENIFKKKDECDIMQEFLDRPPLEIFDKTDQGIFFEDVFHSRQRIDFRKKLQEKKLSFSAENFRIKTIKEIAKLEYGENFSQCCYIGRVYFKKPNTFYEGEIQPNMDGSHELQGFGRYFDNSMYTDGIFHNHLLNGQGKHVHSTG